MVPIFLACAAPQAQPDAHTAAPKALSATCEAVVTRELAWWRDKYCVLDGAVSGAPLYPVSVGTKTLSDLPSVRAVLTQSFGGDPGKALESNLLAARLNVALFRVGEVPWSDVDGDGALDPIHAALQRADVALRLGTASERVTWLKALVALNAAGAGEGLWFDERCRLPSEGCDGVDDDADGVVDEACSCDLDFDGRLDVFVGGDDCDDEDPAIPAAAEVCANGVDDDCDGVTDSHDWYADLDGDGHGDAGLSVASCPEPGTGWVTDATDCDDTEEGVHPGATEVCDGVDGDCDGSVDEHAVDGVAWSADADLDGYGDPATTVLACAPPSGFVEDATDCDDTAAAVHPGAADAWYDGVDADCAGDSDFDADGDGEDTLASGGTDCDDTDPSLNAHTVWYRDADGDGWGIDALTLERCLVGSGWSVASGDCDDTDPALHLDDPDGDGFSTCAGDCDEADAAVNPDAVEVCGNGVDDDCDGGVGPCGLSGTQDLADAWVRLTGATSSGYLGRHLAGGDLTADGSADLLVTGDGQVGLWAGGSLASGTGASADLALTGLAAALFGAADLDGDGVDDLVGGNVGASAYAGAAYAVLGPLTASVGFVASAAVTLTGAAADDYLGEAGALGDVDGDGVTDVLTGATGAEVGASYNVGRAYVFSGATLATGSAASADVTVDGDASGVWFGSSTFAHDVDGDGVGDLMVGGTRAAGSGTAVYPGGLFLYQGPVTSDRTQSDADVAWEGSSNWADLGRSLAVADLDGDGHADLLAGEPYASDGVTEVGAAWVLAGPPASGGVAADVASFRLVGTETWSFLGWRLEAPGDLDGDGVPELAVAASDADGAVTDAGVVYVVSAATGTLLVDESTALASLRGEAKDGVAGYALDLPGDLDGDGAADLVVGGYYGGYDGLTRNGAAWVVSLGAAP